MRRLVVASAILATLLIVPLGSAAATPNPSVPATDSDRATAALEYLLAAQKPNGSIDGTLGETADFVIAAAAAGYDPSTLHGCTGGTGALSFIATASDAGTADAAQTGKAILAVVAAGGDPASFLGRDLTGRLNALYHSTTGAYGDGSTYSQSFAILAVVASGGSAPANATGELVALQNVDDGAWSFGSAPVAAGLGDTNSTAMALMALDAAGVTSADSKGFAYLRTQQQDDGGFIYASMYGPPADPDSDALVLQALVANGQDPEATGWSKGSNNVLTHLRSTQSPDGGFAHPIYGESVFVTSEVPAALMRVPYAAATHPTVGRSVPTTSCPASTPTPTATPVPTASPTPTPTPTPTPAPTVRPTARPTVRPTDQPATPSPTDSIESTPSPTLIATPTSTPSASLSERVAGLTAEPAAPTPGSSDPNVPPALLYGGAALAGLLIVVGGGAYLMTRPAKP